MNRPMHWLATTLTLSMLLIAPGRAVKAQDVAPLHQRIDEMLAADQIGPVAGTASEPDFLRRVYLDLTGTIPPLDEARAYLSDSSSDKRRLLIDRLLASPQYARHMSEVFDAAMMERRAAAHTDEAAWRQYLYDSFAADKPWRLLVQEILAADGATPETRHQARFILDRNADPHLLTRDAGRMFFGRDLQCAQCHDHPLIDGYRQSEYQSLAAFFARTSIVKIKNDKGEERTVLAEKAESNDSYVSVFDKRWTLTARPGAPGGALVDDPALPADQLYQVKPADGVRHVPTYSRRQKLAELLGSGQNRLFARNLANRLWTLMMGTGLIEPVDLDHPQNPPSHPELLEVLTDAVMQTDYNVRGLLRELALTQVYQRSIDLPSDSELAAAYSTAEPRLAAARTEHEQLTVSLKQLEEAYFAADEALIDARSAVAKLKEPRKAAADALASAQKANDEAATTLAQVQAQHAARVEAQKLLAEAAAKAQEAAAKLAGKAEVALAATVLKTQAEQGATELSAMESAMAQTTSAMQQTGTSLAAAQEADAAAAAALATAQQVESTAIASLNTAFLMRSEKQAAVKRIEREISALSALLHYRDSGRGEPARIALSEQWTRLGALHALKPLSPEQLAWSTLEATGIAASYRAAAEAELKQKAAQPAAEGQEPAPMTVAPRDIERHVTRTLKGSVDAFVHYFGSGPGAPQDPSQSTVDQALFMSNNGLIDSWARPNGANLGQKLMSLEDPAAIAAEAYLAVLTRPPSEEEVALVRQHLAARPDEKAAAVAELIWSLLASAEFRFNH